MFLKDLFSCKRKFYLFIVFVFMEIWSRYSENIKRIFIFKYDQPQGNVTRYNL